ncbi:TonB-dependent siderophore receptor [Rhizobium sp.]|uniref:TonB-dependent siderophore receptor n=1 Tax=Rhizobium sp. TaxID=391 RepID=UPI002899CC51
MSGSIVSNAFAKKSRNRGRFLVLLSSCAIVLPLHAFAQNAEETDAGTTLKPIVLQGDGSPVGPDSTIVAKSSRTSSKTDTPILDSAAAVSVVTQKEMDERGVKTLDEALSYTPGVLTDVYGSDNRYDHYLIRGFYSTGQSTFLDGLPVRSINFTGSRMEPYGMQRMEVLKGANSTLFGISQPGGIVNAISKRPQDYKFGEVYTTFGEDHIETGTDFGGPIDPDGVWSYRLTAKWQDAKQGIEYSQDDRVYIAPALTFSPSADTDFTLLTSYNKRNGSTSHSIPYSLRGQIDSETYLGEPDFDNMDTIERNIGYDFRHDFGNGFEFRQNVRYTNLDLTYEGVYATSPTIGAVRGALGVYGEAKRFDIDNQLQYDASFGLFDSRTLLGVSYEHDKLRERRLDGQVAGIDPSNPIYSGAGSIVFGPASISEGTQATKSVYLQEELTFDKRWILTLGGRYDHSESEAGSDEAVDEAFTPRAGLTFKATDELSFYGSYSESFQPLGASRGLLKGDAKPQEGSQYEVGMKYQPTGTDMLFTAALFDLTQKNVSQYTPDYSAQYQIGKINVRGLELEAKVALADELNLTAGYSYWDSEVEEDVIPANIGKRPARVPKNMVSLWADYTIPGNGLLGDLNLALGMRYLGPTYADDANTIALASRTLFDAAVRYKVRDDVTLAINATNLFDKEYVTHVDTSSMSAFYGDRRKVLATLKYTW